MDGTRTRYLVEYSLFFYQINGAPLQILIKTDCSALLVIFRVAGRYGGGALALVMTCQY